MTAQEARAITEKTGNLLERSEKIKSLLRYFYGSVRSTAEGGESTVHNVFVGIRTPISESEIEEIYRILRQEGYKVVTFRTHLYSTISW